jgi:hypothetical protein
MISVYAGKQFPSPFPDLQMLRVLRQPRVDPNQFRFAFDVPDIDLRKPKNGTLPFCVFLFV